VDVSVIARRRLAAAAAAAAVVGGVFRRRQLLLLLLLLFVPISSPRRSKFRLDTAARVRERARVVCSIVRRRGGFVVARRDGCSIVRAVVVASPSSALAFLAESYLFSARRSYARSFLRPEIGRDYPLNLSILISGGKETNKDSLSNGE
jgi:hypothetical protein